MIHRTGSSAPSRQPKHRAAPPTARADVHTEPLEPRLLCASTDDPLFSSQYAIASTGVSDAWNTTRGSAAVVVADIDTGADYTHRDLYANVWINQAEIPSSLRPGLRDTDNDGRISFYDLNNPVNRPLVTDVNHNGYIDGGDLLNPVSVGGWEDNQNGRSNPNDRYVDDIIGWDFAEGDNDPYDDPGPNGGHGTHTAGIVGAMGGNGVGVSGVAQRVSMIIARIFSDDGLGAIAARIAEAVRYTADSGARVANASWGSPAGRNGDATYNAIAYAGNRGQVFVAAAGNAGRNIDSGAYANYPAKYNLANIIAVAATTSTGGLAPYSNYGATTVDVAAPGSGIYSTLPGDVYGGMSGTSMATPMVTGAVALMLSANRSLTVTQVKQRVIAGADESPAANNRSVSDGQLNVSNALSNRAGVQPAAAATSTVRTASVAEWTGMSLTRAGRFSTRRIRLAAADV